MILGYALTFGWVFATMGISLLAKKLFSVSSETSRKIVHILCAFAWIPMMLCFGSTWHLVVPPLCFAVLNYISARKNIFSMMEREDEGKKSYGTVYYALSMAILALISVIKPQFMLPFGIGMLCMSLGDGLAPLVGSIKFGNAELFGGRRTVFGSASVFVLSLLVVLSFRGIFHMELAAYECVIIAVCAALLELVGVNGFDNLTLPLGTAALTYLFLVI